MTRFMYVKLTFDFNILYLKPKILLSPLLHNEVCALYKIHATGTEEKKTSVVIKWNSAALIWGVRGTYFSTFKWFYKVSHF